MDLGLTECSVKCLDQTATALWSDRPKGGESMAGFESQKLYMLVGTRSRM